MQFIHPWQILGMIVLVAGFIYYRKREAAKRPPAETKESKEDAEVRAAVARMAKPDETPAAVYTRLRKEAFGMAAQRYGMAEAGREDQPFGVVMEIGIPESVVTVAGYIDGDARVYYQNGGGMVGGFAHENTRVAAKAYVAAAQPVLRHLAKSAEQPPLPTEGRLRFSVLTARGIVTAEVDREVVGNEGNPFHALYYAGQEVVAQMRQVSTKKS